MIGFEGEVERIIEHKNQILEDFARAYLATLPTELLRDPDLLQKVELVHYTETINNIVYYHYFYHIRPNPTTHEE